MSIRLSSLLICSRIRVAVCSRIIATFSASVVVIIRLWQESGASEQGGEVVTGRLGDHHPDDDESRELNGEVEVAHPNQLAQYPVWEEKSCLYNAV